LVACGAIFGVYYAASFLNLDPWHMFTSYPQYLFVASSYTNILNIYAFSNWHDVSWGAKQGSKSEAADSLPSISTQANCQRRNDLFTEELEKPQEDIDSQFEAMVKRALKPYVPEKSKAQGPTVEESFKVFRTRLVIVYLFSNFILCIFVMNDSFDSLKFLVS
jgi:chitin synthase